MIQAANFALAEYSFFTVITGFWLKLSERRVDGLINKEIILKSYH
jgi:hypothetical protein